MRGRPLLTRMHGLGSAAMVAGCLLMTLCAWGRDGVAPATRSGSGPAGGDAARYVGNMACSECHHREFAKHRGSRHDITLRPADARLLGALTPPTGPVAGTAYTIARNGDRFSFGLANAPSQARPVELAFGSGKTGMTYVSLGEANQLTEFRMSRIPSGRSWYITPGQESRADLDPGMVHSPDMTRRCLGCHSISLPEDSPRPAVNMLGVGCESCHGPGSLHIAAARIKGNTDLKIERMSRWSARQVNTLCGRCHRSLDDVSLVTRDASSTQRFQPYGLMLSPCYRKSGERLSCVTCHDAHANVSTGEKEYERVCLSCHRSPAQVPVDPRVDKSALHQAGTCPVNAREKCIGCHMPSTQIFPGSKLPVKMADHMIWAYGKKRRE